MLTLTQDAQSGVNGTLTGFGSSSLQVQARVEAEGLRGTAGNSFGLLYLTGRLTSEALTRNAWFSFTYNISGNRNMERLVFTRSGLVKQTPGKQAHWRVQNETLEFSPDGISWSPQPLRLALNAIGSAVLQSHDKEYAQCD